MGSTNCTIEYGSEDTFWCIDSILDQHKELTKSIFQGIEYDAIIPNRNWCCGSGFSAWKCTENDFLIKHDKEGWIQVSKEKENCKKFTYIHFEFKNRDVLENAWKIMSDIENKYSISHKNCRIYYLTNWYIMDATETKKINNVVLELSIHKNIFCNVETQESQCVKKGY